MNDIYKKAEAIKFDFEKQRQEAIKRTSELYQLSEAFRKMASKLRKIKKVQDNLIRKRSAIDPPSTSYTLPN